MGKNRKNSEIVTKFEVGMVIALYSFPEKTRIIGTNRE